MIENSVKKVNLIDNSQWRERHEFVLSVNDNIICQRYFKVNGFNATSLHSIDLLDTIHDIVEMIKKDLVSKSRIYTDITMSKRTKLTGFYQKDDVDYEDLFKICDDRIEGDVELSNGTVINKTYVDQDVVEEEDNEEVVFKFSYYFDNRLIYQEAWDGTVYPKYIRNSVDLSNSNASFKYTDPMRMSFSQQMTKHLVDGRSDLIYTIIRLLCNTLSNEVDENGKSTDKEYTTDMTYGDKIYSCNPYPREYVRGWANAVRQKTINYKRWAENDIPKSKLDYIDKYM